MGIANPPRLLSMVRGTCLNWHNLKMKSSVTVELCKGMKTDAFYGVNGDSKVAKSLQISKSINNEMH